MRSLAALVLVALIGLLAASPAGAQPPITTCALTGVYVLSAALAVSGEAQVSGQFTFTPPGSCTAGETGTVQLQVSILFAGSPTSSPFAGSFPYAVDASGGVTIGTGLIQGGIAGVADTGIANSVVFEADPAIAPATIRFAGIAVRVDASNTIGDNNTVVGSGALRSNTTGFSNTATGFSALSSNTTGQRNTATGDSALLSNTTGHSNTATGLAALHSNTTGFSNTACGQSALFTNTSGFSNTACGQGALSANIIGIQNTATGSTALENNTTGQNNTASGAGALQNNTTGFNNIAIGFEAGFNATTGSDNIYIGNLGVAAEAATIRIGDPAVQTSRAFIAGISGATSTGGVAVLVNSNGRLGTTTSSRRFKEDVRDMGDVSTGLMQLRPVTFRYQPEYDDGTRLLQYGLIAEEVAQVYPELVARTPGGEPYTVRYHLLPAMLLNEVQQQHRTIEAQRRQIEAQEKRFHSQQDQLEAQAAQLAELMARLARLEGRADLAASR